MIQTTFLRCFLTQERADLSVALFKSISRKSKKTYCAKSVLNVK